MEKASNEFRQEYGNKTYVFINLFLNQHFHWTHKQYNNYMYVNGNEHVTNKTLILLYYY